MSVSLYSDIIKASPLFCILDTPLPPETEVCPRLWLLSALCWGHWWPGRCWEDTCWLIQLRDPGYFISWVRSVTSTQTAISRMDSLNLLISVLGQVHRLSVTLLSPLPLASIASSTPYLLRALLCAPSALRVHVHCARDHPVSRLHIVWLSVPFLIRPLWGVFSLLTVHGGHPNTVSIMGLLLFFSLCFTLPPTFFFFPFLRNQYGIVSKDTSSDSDNLPFHLVLPLVITSSWEIKLAHCAIRGSPENGWIILNNDMNWAGGFCIEWGS